MSTTIQVHDTLQDLAVKVAYCQNASNVLLGIEYRRQLDRWEQ